MGNFLDLRMAQKLNWITHIHNIKSKYAKDLSLMRSVSGSKWGAVQETLLRIYRALIWIPLFMDLLVKPHLNTWMLLSMMQRN